MALASALWMLLSLCFLDFATTQDDGWVGVNVGDWARYGDITVTWNSTDPDAEKTQEIIDLENTAWFENEVVNITEGQITFRQTTQFKNDTQKTSMLKVDIYTGLGNGTFMFIPAGLGEDVLVYPYSIELSDIWINETISRIYAGALREANHLHITQIGLNGGYSEISLSHYWDKETGVLTERYGSIVNRSGNYVTATTRSDKIIDTALWEAANGDGVPSNNGDAGVYVIAGVVSAAVILVAAWAFWPKKKKPKTRKSRKQR